MLNDEHFGIRKVKIQEEQVLNLFRCGGFKFTEKWFPYTSGQIGNYYVQSIDICSDGEAYALAIQHMVELITCEIGLDNFDVISGGESRDWDFSNPVAVALCKPHAKIYKDGKIIGAKLEGKRVLHIADLNNEGSSPRDLWVPAIKKAGGIIKHIAFYVDRMEDGIDEMKKLELQSHAVIELDQEAWSILRRHQKVTSEVYDSLIIRWRDKKAWAHHALVNHPEVMKDLLGKDAKKGEKILATYPEVKQALMEIMYG